MENLKEMINEVRDELRFVYACDTSDGDMTNERRKYLYTLLTRFMSLRADNAVKINALKDTLRSLENLDSVYNTIK